MERKDLNPSTKPQNWDILSIDNMTCLILVRVLSCRDYERDHHNRRLGAMDGRAARNREPRIQRSKDSV